MNTQSKFFVFLHFSLTILVRLIFSVTSFPLALIWMKIYFQNGNRIVVAKILFKDSCECTALEIQSALTLCHCWKHIRFTISLCVLCANMKSKLAFEFTMIIYMLIKCWMFYIWCHGGPWQSRNVCVITILSPCVKIRHQIQYIQILLNNFACCECNMKGLDPTVRDKITHLSLVHLLLGSKLKWMLLVHPTFPKILRFLVSSTFPLKRIAAYGAIVIL